jgi:hypothetical protein
MDHGDPALKTLRPCPPCPSLYVTRGLGVLAGPLRQSGESKGQTGADGMKPRTIAFCMGLWLQLAMKISELIREHAALPLRRNSLKAQREALGLSRAALARILEVDPTTVYRQELANPMSMLWNYALRGLAAESKDKALKRRRRDQQAELVQNDELLGASRMDAYGYRFTAEKMREAAREHAAPIRQVRRQRGKTSARAESAPHPSAPRIPTKSAIRLMPH